MTTTVAPDLKPDHSQAAAWPTLVPDLADTEREAAGERSFDPTQGRTVGFDPYDDPTQGRKLGSDPSDDPTRAR